MNSRQVWWGLTHQACSHQPTTMLKLADMAAAIRAFKSAIQHDTVPPEDILRRSNICMQCKLKAKPRVLSLDSVSKAMGMFANSEKVKREIKDFKCGACDCSLMMLVPATGPDLHRDSPQQAALRAKKAPECWIPAERE